ncbi:MAG: hypothetical protein IKV99_07590 [Oscillospiraceae bacterium]|nr:hypothetical protein [Oscillospiraceae bacterium]
MDLQALSKSMNLTPQALEKLSQSPDGQALMAILQKNNANAFHHATEAGKNGNYAEMTALIKNVMGTAEGRALLQRLARQLKNT